MTNTAVSVLLQKILLVPMVALWALHLSQRRFKDAGTRKRIATLSLTMVLIGGWVAAWLFARYGVDDGWLILVAVGAVAIVAWQRRLMLPFPPALREMRRTPVDRQDVFLGLEQMRGLRASCSGRRDDSMKNRKLSMPFWCVGNPVGDPFGQAVMDRITSVEVCDILCKARQEKLIDFTSAHDDDLVCLGPAPPGGRPGPIEPRVEDPEDHQGEDGRGGAEGA